MYIKTWMLALAIGVVGVISHYYVWIHIIFVLLLCVLGYVYLVLLDKVKGYTQLNKNISELELKRTNLLTDLERAEHTRNKTLYLISQFRSVLDEGRVDTLTAEIKFNSIYKVFMDLDNEVSKRNENCKTLMSQEKELTKAVQVLMHEKEALTEFINSADYIIGLQNVLPYIPNPLVSTEAHQLLIKEIESEIKELQTKNLAITQLNLEKHAQDDKNTIKAFNKLKLFLLNSFNEYSNNLISKLTVDHLDSYTKKIIKAAANLNNSVIHFDFRLNENYINLYLKKLYAAHELLILRKEERELAREEYENKKEEAKVEAEMQALIAKTEAEEVLVEKEIQKVKNAMSMAHQDEITQLNLKLAQLESNLKVAQDANQRALSMAQQTKAGHVYVISNIGAFGERVYKVGMTRRLEPLDRVRELGDASVPFYFDTHALIFSEDAPLLEKQLHAELEPYRVNKINIRREFFNVGLDQIIETVHKYDPTIIFNVEHEAEDYRASLEMSATK